MSKDVSSLKATGLGVRSTLLLVLAFALFLAGLIAALILISATETEVRATLVAQHKARVDLLRQHLEVIPEADWPAAVARFGANDASVVTNDLLPQEGFFASSITREAIVLDVRNGQRLSNKVADASHVVATALRPPSGAHSILVVRFNFDATDAALTDRQTTVLLYLAADFLLVLLLGVYLIGWLVVRPMEALSEIAARENLDDPQSMALRNISGPSEVNRLSNALADLVEGLESKNRHLSASLMELEATRDSLIRSEKLATVGRLAAGIAHEIGNPLASVVGFVEYLRSSEEIDHETRSELLGRMDKQLGRMSTTLRQLLDYSRPGADTPTLVRVEDLVESTIHLAGYHRRMSGIQFKTSGESAPIFIDPQLLEQVLLNVFINAADAMDGKGLIEVIISRLDGQSCIQIKDSGPGIDPELLPRIFDPFLSTKPAGSGTGLGLSVSQRFIESAGGSISAENVSGGGARFEILLPAHRPDAIR